MHTQHIVLASHGVVLVPGEARFNPGAISGLYSLVHEQGFSVYITHSKHFTPALQRILLDEGIRFETLHPEVLLEFLTHRPDAVYIAHPTEPINGLEAYTERILRFDPAATPGTLTDWGAIRRYFTLSHRVASIQRATAETDIRIDLDLDGTGKASIQTGLGFLDHMLDQIARHGSFDLNINARGDLHIDEHHTVEDIALALGQAFNQALADRKGIERYSFVLPMDEAQATVSIDLGGRPYLVWNATFQREKIGDVATELFEHFFKSFTDTARCTLHIAAEGRNEHHKIESVFKGFARVLKGSVRRTGSDAIPSTKGVL
jgi:imidazoleglycerol phosphate dehydratase HisB